MQSLRHISATQRLQLKYLYLLYDLFPDEMDDDVSPVEDSS
jgi:hypothetical protein